MAEALQYLHEEKFMVHRDLHWGNWMLLENNEVRLIDFGLALTLGKDGFSKDYWMPDCFAAPEVAARKGSDFAADIWYIGHTMYGLVHPKGYCPWMSGQFDM